MECVHAWHKTITCARCGFDIPDTVERECDQLRSLLRWVRTVAAGLEDQAIRRRIDESGLLKPSGIDLGEGTST